MINEQTPLPDNQRKLLKTAENPENFQLLSAILTRPFNNIAMALSGGGFRAAAYSLGAMSYLQNLVYDEPGNKRSVLNNVEFVSSASGGTFTAILYTMHVLEKVPFETTYHQLISFMNGQVLLQDVLTLINQDDQWKGDKSRNFINGFAKIYDEKLFEGKTFGVFVPDQGEPVSRSMEVCFNATEFYRGLSFRFQASAGLAPKGITGNRYVFFDKFNPESIRTLKMIKLGDILAASSCFPAGFEPILFPVDFSYTGATGENLDKERLRKAFRITDYDNHPMLTASDIGLMDGGVDDNQGVYSMMLADRRRRRNNPASGFGLIFVTDVASYFMKPYEAPEVSANSEFSRQTISELLNKPVKELVRRPGKLVSWGKYLFLILSVVFLVITIAAAGKFVYDAGLVITTLSLTICIALWAVDKFLLSKPVHTFLPAGFSLPDSEAAKVVKDAVPALKNFSDDAVSSFIRYIKTAKLGVLGQMISSRLNSTLSMVLEINLKQTRRLIFDTFYGNFYGENIWQNRRVFNVIYELSELNVASRLEILKNKFNTKLGAELNMESGKGSWPDKCIHVLTDDCLSLNKVAESARTMGTTLWFDESDSKNNRLRDVVASGQFTTCAKLLEYVYSVERILQKQASDPDFPKEVILDSVQQEIFARIKIQLEKDWEKFKTEPYFLADALDAQRDASKVVQTGQVFDSI